MTISVILASSADSPGDIHTEELAMSAKTDGPMPTRADGRRQPSSAARTGTGASMIGALVLLATVQLMVVLDTTIVNVALPTIQAKVGFSTSGIAWVVNGYALSFGALLLVGGRSGDTLGRRNVLDRKSTRLNSSHGYISYAVFCLKKKKR